MTEMKWTIGGTAEPGSSMVNFTGGWRSFRPIVNDPICTGCGICMMFCPDDCIRMVEIEGEKKHRVDLNYCKGCGICDEVCPVDAIKMELEEV